MLRAVSQQFQATFCRRWNRRSKNGRFRQIAWGFGRLDKSAPAKRLDARRSGHCWRSRAGGGESDLRRLRNWVVRVLRVPCAQERYSQHNLRRPTARHEARNTRPHELRTIINLQSRPQQPLNLCVKGVIDSERAVSSLNIRANVSGCHQERATLHKKEGSSRNSDWLGRPDLSP